MVAKLGLYRRISINRLVTGRDGQLECSFLKGSHHRPSNHPAQVTTTASFIFWIGSRHFIKPHSWFDLLDRFQGFRLFFTQNVPHLSECLDQNIVTVSQQRDTFTEFPPFFSLPAESSFGPFAPFVAVLLAFFGGIVVSEADWLIYLSSNSAVIKAHRATVSECLSHVHAWQSGTSLPLFLPSPVHRCQQARQKFVWQSVTLTAHDRVLLCLGFCVKPGTNPSWNYPPTSSPNVQSALSLASSQVDVPPCSALCDHRGNLTPACLHPLPSSLSKMSLNKRVKSYNYGKPFFYIEDDDSKSQVIVLLHGTNWVYFSHVANTYTRVNCPFLLTATVQTLPLWHNCGLLSHTKNYMTKHLWLDLLANRQRLFHSVKVSCSESYSSFQACTFVK